MKQDKSNANKIITGFTYKFLKFEQRQYVDSHSSKQNSKQLIKNHKQET